MKLVVNITIIFVRIDLTKNNLVFNVIVYKFRVRILHKIFFCLANRLMLIQELLIRNK